MSIEKFRDAGYTKVQPNGDETIWFRHGESDPDGRRCYCVVFGDMQINDVVIMTAKQAFLLELKHADKIVIADWTEMFNMQPHMLDELGPNKYGIELKCEYTFEDVYNYNSCV